MKNYDKQIPQTILETHGECAICGGFTCISHLNTFDKKFQKTFDLMFGAKTGWIVFCEDCENMGFVNE